MVCDAKPVYFITTLMEDLKWITIDSKVYDYDQQKQVLMGFLRTNFQHVHNSYMNGADATDQLRGNYRIDANIRNMKWWWSLFFWTYGN